MIVCPNCKAQNRDTARFCRQCGAQLVRTPAPGIVLGGEYRVVEVIKPGGMGTVYKAESGGKLYAVKEMRDTFTNPKERQDAINRFMAEALILARLSHPHIPKVHCHFIENDRYYLVMDFIEGEDLRAVLDQQGGKGLPEEQVLSWALQICAVLEYLHGQTPPVIFRDLKPANIMLRPSGDISLIDFGIAKLFNPAQQGTLIGTPGYAAPEQYQGLAEPRSDIFALGATLHHLLTGRDPQQHPPFNFPPVTAVNPAITSGLEAIVQKALQMNLEQRWTSVGEVRQALMRLAGPIKLEPGVVLAGRYQITGKGLERRGGRQRPWEIVSFEARDLQMGAKCWVIPMGADPVEDQFMQRLAGLHHQALPRMEVVVHRGITCFVSHAVEGIPLNEVSIKNPSELISIGLQLCDLLETTGSHGARFYWGHLQAPHVLLGPQGQVFVNGFNYCYDWLYEHQLRASTETRKWPPFLSFFGPVMSGEPLPEDTEAVEVEIVGGAMACPLGSGYSFELGNHPQKLREKLPQIPPYLEQAILSAALSRSMERPCIRSLAQLRQHLLGQAEGPARATVSTQRVDFSSVPWGESLSHSVQLSSQSPGLLYGEIRCNLTLPTSATIRCTGCGLDNALGEFFCYNCGNSLKTPPQAKLKAPRRTLELETQPCAFVKVHPCQIEIRISCDTSELETCGDFDGEVLITTGVDSFKIAVQANLQPNAAFRHTQAQRHLNRKEWVPAIQHCDNLIALQPSDFGGYYLRGQAYYGLAQYGSAARDYTKALRINPDNAEILNRRGNAYLGLNQYDLAIQDYSEAIKLDPKQPVYYWNRSIAYEYKGQIRDAINDLHQYISLGGENTQDAKQKIAELQRA